MTLSPKQTKLALAAGVVVGGALLVARYGRQQLSKEIQGGFTAAELESLDSQTSWLDAFKAGLRKLTGQQATPVNYSLVS